MFDKTGRMSGVIADPNDVRELQKNHSRSTFTPHPHREFSHSFAIGHPVLATKPIILQIKRISVIIWPSHLPVKMPVNEAAIYPAFCIIAFHSPARFRVCRTTFGLD